MVSRLFGSPPFIGHYQLKDKSCGQEQTNHLIESSFRQIHVINSCQLTVLMPLFSNRIKEQLLFFDNQKTKIVIHFLLLVTCF